LGASQFVTFRVQTMQLAVVTVQEKAVHQAHHVMAHTEMKGSIVESNAKSVYPIYHLYGGKLQKPTTACEPYARGIISDYP
jgi:hypothetical protein